MRILLFTSLLALPLMAASPLAGLAPQQEEKEKPKKPALSLRAAPLITFSPARIHLIAELRGGPDDYEEMYCPSVEWDWGDGTRSESSPDCDPYEKGVSEITRRYSTDHTFEFSGRYRVQLRLKRNSKTVASASTTIQIRPGVRDGIPY